MNGLLALITTIKSLTHGAGDFKRHLVDTDLTLLLN